MRKNPVALFAIVFYMAAGCTTPVAENDRLTGLFSFDHISVINHLEVKRGFRQNRDVSRGIGMLDFKGSIELRPDIVIFNNFDTKIMDLSEGVSDTVSIKFVRLDTRGTSPEYFYKLSDGEMEVLYNESEDISFISFAKREYYLQFLNRGQE